MNDPEVDWATQKSYLVKRLTGKAFFDTQAMAEANIMHSAVYIYNLCHDYDSMDKKEHKSLMKFAMNFEDVEPTDLRVMKKKTNVETIMRVIREKLAVNYKKFLTREIQNKFVDITYNLNRTTKEKKTE